MTELRDVERFRSNLDHFAVGKVIRNAQVLDETIIQNRTSAQFIRCLKGHTLSRSERRGFWLFARVNRLTLLICFEFAGNLVWRQSSCPPDQDDKIILSFDHSELSYQTTNVDSKIWIADGQREIDGITGPLGSDAYGVTREEFARTLSDRNEPLNELLTDQSVIAGIGNELSNEILSAAQITPEANFDDLSPRKADDLYDALQDILTRPSTTNLQPRTNRHLASQ